MKTSTPFLYVLGITILLLSAVSCKTDDVEEGSVVIPSEPVLIPDAAFGEYMLYNGTPGVYEQTEDNEVKYYLDPREVASVSELLLSKTGSNIEALQNAGLATAELKISDLTGLEYFIGLQHLVLTSNTVRNIDVSALIALEQLEINFNLIGQLDLSGNPRLTMLRYRASGNATESEVLTELDLSSNTQLRHLFLPNHQFINIDLSNNLQIDELLDLSDNPGPDGDPETGDIIIPAAIYNQLEEANRSGVISDAQAETTVILSADPASFSENEGSSTITATLNKITDNDVTISLSFSGSATLDEDYAVENTTLVIPAGETKVSTVITAIQDTDEEGNETIEITVSDVSNAVIGMASPLVLTIEDDDKSVPLVLNEILYDPSNSGLDGDANGDGVYAQNEDEFIELYNNSEEPLDVSGFKVYDSEALENDSPRHLIPEGTVIPAHGVLVIFGGGTPTGTFGGAIVQTSTTGDLNLNNAADVLTVTDTNGKVIITFDIEPLSNNPNESYTRNPDITGDFTRHSDVNGLLFSPGTKTDGSSFNP
ncbi:Calx-beta domain-containing protein [Sinomicrobium oceani]|uniref:Calx-beta domain-containing protein n=1 Tax=Sinomicrobium oceani TaxID=1150368 RepID=A0A1K1QFG9_9FLAO|nr:lamin tail domain-containing protein [Sinomicrobium oceani]SFW58647.1 Calx-beta domain-containing protein [Sinomicrobium oceani]